MIINPGVVGIDISKHHLDIFDGAVGRPERVSNAPQAAASLAARFAAAGVFVLFEATGAYDLALRRALEAAGLAFARVNPARARDFARAAGFLAKTDRIDARMLAAMAQSLPAQPQAATDPAREKLASLSRRRDQLVAMRKQERTRRTACCDQAMADDIDRHLAWLNHAIADLDRTIRQLICASASLKQAERRLRSVPGIGPVAAATLLALLPELGMRSSKAIAALAGLAPINADSGMFRGKRSIRGGRKRVRDALYMAAVAAARSNSRLAAIYRALINAAKPPKLALIAVARRILVILNAIVRDKTLFQP